MEPLNDDELKSALRQWTAPNAPPSLERKVLPPEPWWRFLLTASIRVPVPVLVVGAIVVIAVYLRQEPPLPEPAAQPTVSLADFQPVEQVEVRIRRVYEGN